MKQPQTLKFKKLHPKAKLPTRGTDGAAGYDLYLAEDLPYVWKLPEMAKFGIAVEIPEGYCGILVERSSCHKMSLSQANKIGIIDSDYRGELMAPMYNSSGEAMLAGSRVAQLVIVPCFMAEPEWVDELSDTDRGAGGFGSTGS